MNKKLTALANKLESVSVILLLFSALRSDGGLPLWLPIALSGILIGCTGLVLSWLCSEEGRRFRRYAFGEAAAPTLLPRPPVVIPFPKAG